MLDCLSHRRLEGLYRQCELRRGDSVSVRWVPVEFAVQGEVLQVRCDGVWENGWVVHQVFGVPQAPQDVHAVLKAFRKAEGER